MTREEVVQLAEQLGWKPFGKLRPYPNGSRYQCFRRGNHYVWIGMRFVEIDSRYHALDHVDHATTASMVKEWLK